MKNIRFFYLKNCHFLVVKFSVYLNRRVFIMAMAFIAIDKSASFFGGFFFLTCGYSQMCFL